VRLTLTVCVVESFDVKSKILPALLISRRRALNLSQREVAERAGISRQGLNLIERGRVKPQRQTVLALADALALDWRDVEDIFEDEE
jgi:DNA-binding XRE family transcriptional regulator